MKDRDRSLISREIKIANLADEALSLNMAIPDEYLRPPLDENSASEVTCEAGQKCTDSFGESPFRRKSFSKFKLSNFPQRSMASDTSHAYFLRLFSLTKIGRIKLKF